MIGVGDEATRFNSLVNIDTASQRLLAVLDRGLVDPAEPVVFADDLGFARGDGCFDATRVVVGGDGVATADHLDAHIARFARSHRLLELDFDEPAWRALIDTALHAWTRPGESMLKLVSTRGPEFTPAQGRTGVLTIEPLSPAMLRARDGVTATTLSRGYASDAFTDAPWLLGGVKLLSYAVNMAAKREAARRGVDDVILTSSDGYILEGPTAAVVFIKGNTLHTTPIDNTGILPSVTQQALEAAAPSLGLTVQAKLSRRDDLLRADGVWIMSSGRGVAPVLEIDGLVLQQAPEWTTKIVAATGFDVTG